MSGSVPLRVLVRAVRILRFLAWFAVRLVVANLVVAREILTPGSGLHPAVARFPLRARTETEVALMALCVSLTPGTLTLAVRRDPPVLWVHGMHAGDPAAFRRTLAELEDRLLGAARPVGTARRPVEKRR